MTVAHLGNNIFGYLHDFGTTGGSANQPKIEQFKNFAKKFLH